VAKAAAAVAADAAREAGSMTEHAWQAIPLPAKVGAAVVAVLTAVVAVFRVTR